MMRETWVFDGTHTKRDRAELPRVAAKGWGCFCAVVLFGAVGAVAVGMGSGCTVENKKHCDSSDECANGYWCNPDTNRCEPDMGDGGVGDDGEVEECETSAECTEATAPICDETSGECRGCEEGSGECLADYPDRALCDGASGACVACLSSVNDCTEATAPICDETSGSCRGCEEGAGGDAECEAAYGGGGKRCSSEGECVECLASVDDCAEVEAPICDDTSQTCRDCDEDTECEARGEGLDACDDVSGECVECTDSALHCAGIYSPVCDGTSHTCRECESHEECDHVGGLCEFGTGRCLEAGSVVHVDCSATTNGDGTAGSPYNSIQDGVDAVAFGGGPYVLVEGSCGPVTVPGMEELYIYGKGNAELISDSGAAVVSMSIGVGDPVGQVVLDGVTLRGGANHTGEGLKCMCMAATLPTVRLQDVLITDTDREGIQFSTCHVELVDSTVSGSGFHGVSVSEADLTVESSVVTGSENSGVYVSEGNLLMEGSTVSESGTHGVESAEVDAVIRNSTASDNGGKGILFYDGSLTLERSTVKVNLSGGVDASTATVVMWNNIIAVNGSGSASGGGVALGGIQSLDFWHNTVANNYNNNGPSEVLCWETLTLHNSIFAGPQDLLSAECQPEYSYIENGGGGGAKPGCIVSGEEVYFVDEAGHDFHLTGQSPCIDQGTSTGMPAGLTVDIDGENRVQGGGVDMGADEAQ